MRTSLAWMLVGVGCRAAVVCAIGVGAAGCNTAPPKQAHEVEPAPYEGGQDDIEQPGISDAPGADAPTDGRSSDTPTTPAPPGMEGLDEDQKAQIKVALRRGSSKAAECPNVVKDSPLGKGEVQVVFDGTKGRAIDVVVGSPWSGHDVEGCIKRAFVGEIVLPFDGGNRTITQDVELKAAKAPAAPKTAK